MCVEHGDDEEAIARTVGVIAGVGLGAVSKYADDVADLADGTFGSVYKKKIASESSEYVDDIVRSADVKQSKNIGIVDEATDTLDEIGESVLNVSSKPNSKTLRKQLMGSGTSVPDYPNAAHHIVAGNSPKASEARAIMQKFGIDINDASNGVFLPTKNGVTDATYHPSLHTNSYYDKVNKMLSGATCKEDVLDILEFIADELSLGTFI